MPLSVCLRTINAEPRWWLESVRRLDAAGYDGLWAWDHFIGRKEGRLVLGMGIGGGGPREHEMYGMDYPDAKERVARLTEAVAVIRALWTGGPVTRPSAFYPLTDAQAHPVPVPPPPIIIGGETRAGARLAGRVGDGWTAFEDNFEANLPAYLESLEESGRSRADQRVIVGFQGDWLSDEPIDDSPWVTEPREAWARWREAGADGAIVLARSTADVDALVAAVDRW